MWNTNYNFLNNMFYMPTFGNFGWGNNFGYLPPLFNYNLPALPMSLGSSYVPSTTTTTTTTTATRPAAKTVDVDQINNISGNKNRIIEYNKTNYNKNYYGIIDKKTCKLTIYDKNGKEIDSYKLGIGADKGDGLNGGKYTTAGEFTLDENVKIKDAADYTNDKGQYKFMALKGDNRGSVSKIPGIHMIPKSTLSKRADKIASDNLNDKRLSNGCVNMSEDDYDSMYKYLKEGCKIYILPEEEGNELKLRKQSDGSYKFEQTYHQDETRDLAKEAASVVVYDA